jgi:hypothetical protein
MGNIKILICYVFLIIIAQGCQIGDYEQKINGDYYLSALDSKQNMEIVYIDKQSYMFSVIGATVFSIGSNDEFIIAKQHPKKFPNKSNKSITNYFIIPIKNKKSDIIEKNIIGPLTEIQFKNQKKNLNITNIAFDTTFDELK